ncbi:helix-turn-helix transcriptional regulator [Rhizobium leguminosarum]|uniref:HxlR family transcriptional regulator n=1 Tax=Rhizobium leguminosarum TaxID=384 RepID=A0A1B1C7L0_RHILE|nr:helix-turn-helix domain-containing protein [Rhizobium leguminosarum]ANP85699.1 HxlR family transcriptional regulator [Rhizobium leguminosarum]MBY5651870.1 helix-turn-helix transcriptional regulator [Rhizobium leguminosarum]
MSKSTDNCGFATAIKMIEGKWKVDILCELGTASRRFGRLRQAIPEISEKMLAQQLRELEADGLVDRKAYPELPAKVVYSLTERGVALNAAAEALCRWAEQFSPIADASTQVYAAPASLQNVS